MTDTIQTNPTRDAYEARMDRDEMIAQLEAAAEAMGINVEFVTHEPEFHPRWQELHETAAAPQAPLHPQEEIDPMRDLADPGYIAAPGETAALGFIADATQALTEIEELLDRVETLTIAAHNAGYLTTEEFEETGTEDIKAVIGLAKMKREGGE